MLCSKCYKKISDGEEVAKTVGYWKVNGWGRWGSEIFCKKCAIYQDKRDKLIFCLFFLFPLMTMFIFWIVWILWKIIS